MAGPRLLDTNILVRHLRQDHPDHSPRATAYLARLERGEFKVRLADTVVFETAFTLERAYRVSRTAIRDNLLPILLLPGVILPGKRHFRRVFDRWVQQPRLSFADCYHAVLVERLGLEGIVSFDRDFDQ